MNADFWNGFNLGYFLGGLLGVIIGLFMPYVEDRIWPKPTKPKDTPA